VPIRAQGQDRALCGSTSEVRVVQAPSLRGSLAVREASGSEHSPTAAPAVSLGGKCLGCMGGAAALLSGSGRPRRGALNRHGPKTPRAGPCARKCFPCGNICGVRLRVPQPCHRERLAWRQRGALAAVLGACVSTSEMEPSPPAKRVGFVGPIVAHFLARHFGPRSGAYSACEVLRGRHRALPD
jgi:hypothetical protein